MLRPIPREAPVRMMTFEEDMLFEISWREVCERMLFGQELEEEEWEEPKRESWVEERHVILK